LREKCEGLIVDKSMWRCSGQHWLNAAFAWSIAGLAVGVIGELGAFDTGEEAERFYAAPALSAARLNFAGEGGSLALRSGIVSIELKRLDIAGIDQRAFGDSEEAALSMASPVHAK
jgi:hypothetical protein